jgi:hypothetical protein
MCAKASARSVATMRLSLPSLIAAVGAPAAVRAAATPAQGADAIFGGTATGGAPTSCDGGGVTWKAATG